MSDFKNPRFFNFQALDPKFVLALEPKVLKLEGSSFEKLPSKSTHNSDFVGKGVFAPHAMAEIAL